MHVRLWHSVSGYIFPYGGNSTQKYKLALSAIIKMSVGRNLTQDRDILPHPGARPGEGAHRLAAGGWVFTHVAVQAQPKRPIWVCPPLGPPPARGVIGIWHLVDQAVTTGVLGSEGMESILL